MVNEFWRVDYDEFDDDLDDMEDIQDVEMSAEAEGKEKDFLDEWLDNEINIGTGFASTFWLFNEPDIDNLVTEAGDFLDSMFERYGVKPAEVEGGSPTIYAARYEIGSYEGNLSYAEAILPIYRTAGNVVGWMDFLNGIPFGVAEMQVRIWELSMRDKHYPSLADPGSPVPPVPDEFFDERYSADDCLFNYLYIEDDRIDAMSDGISGEPVPDMHWWMRYNMVLPDETVNPQKYPIPGEFVALGTRLFPDKPWGDQSTSPFLFTGNWIDTLYYTTAVVVEVIEPDDIVPFPRYKVKWRGKENNEFTVHPSGFERYEVGDRVAILKDAATTRTSQTWKDDREFVPEIWRIVPVTFYEAPEE